MNFKILFFTTLLVSPFHLPALVSAGEPVALTAEQARRFALKNSRDLKVAELEIERAKSKLRWSGRLKNPELEIGGSTDALGLQDDEGSFAVAFSQRFPVTSKLKDEKEVRRVALVLAETEIGLHRRELVAEVDRVVVRLLSLQQANVYRRELAELNATMVEYLKGRVAAGEVSSLDLAQARLNGKALERQIARSEAQSLQASLELKKLIGMDFEGRVKVLGDLEIPAQPPAEFLPIDPVLQRRPDYLATLVKRDLAKAELILAKNSVWEDIDLKLFVESEWSVDLPEGNERNTFVGVGVSIPLPLRNKNEDAISEAGIDVRKADLSRDALTFSIRSDVQAALSDRASAYKLAEEAGGEIIKLAEANLENHQSAYQKGLTGLVTVQKAQEQLLEIRNAAVEMKREYHLAEARVRYATADYPELRGFLSSQTVGGK